MIDETISKKRLIAAMITNALVFPGCGHIFIGQKVKGAVITIASLALIFIPLIKYILTVIDALDQITNNLRNAGLGDGLSALSTAWETNANSILISLAIVIALWIYGIVDIYLMIRSIPAIDCKNRIS